MALNKQQLEAITLLFDGELTDRQIAEQLGVDVRTLHRWQDNPEFTAELDTLYQEFIKHTRSRALTFREKRLACKIDRHQALTRLINSRAQPDDREPGLATGMLIKRPHTNAFGPPTFHVDRITLRELNQLEKDIAKELGQDHPNWDDPHSPVANIDCLSKEEYAIFAALIRSISRNNKWMNQPTSMERNTKYPQSPRTLISRILRADRVRSDNTEHQPVTPQSESKTD